MTHKVDLLNKLIRIELFNLKKICPLVYKNTHNNNYYTRLDHYSLEMDNTFINYNKSAYLPNTMRRIGLSHIYFVNGYNKNISLKEYITTKYHVKE